MRNFLGSRNVRSAAAFTGTLAVVAGVSAFGLSTQASAGDTTAPANTAAQQLAAQPAGSSAQTVAITRTTRTKLVRTTPEGLLTALLSDLPKGRTSNYAGNAASVEGNSITQLMAQTYLDTGKGPGMMRLSVDQIDNPDRPDKLVKDEQALASKPLPNEKSFTQKDGDVITVLRIPENCIQSLVVSRVSPDGTAVQLSVASCLAWDGTQNKPARLALTQKQAIKVVDDHRIGLKMPKKLVDQGAQRFPDLPGIS